MSMPEHAWRSALEDALVEWFAVEDLRQLVQSLDGGRALSHDLVEGPVSRRIYVHDLVTRLLCRGALEGQFLDRVADMRPERVAELRRVARAAGFSLNDARTVAGTGADDSEFCASIQAVNETVRRLTEEQKSVRSHLHGRRRVAVPGCAGSGKTLVAVEKAVRLSKAGLRVLMLCVSQNLAAYLRRLVGPAYVDAMDFGDWISSLAGEPPSINWTAGEYPSDGLLERALRRLEETNSPPYDAIVVDEGQDFAFEWWVLVDAAIGGSNRGILYVFHDDNQALLPLRAEYHVDRWERSMSRNCRNSGEVFSFVGRLHPNAPDPDRELARTGSIERWETHWSAHGDLSAGEVCPLVRDSLGPLIENGLARWTGSVVVIVPDQGDLVDCLVMHSEPIVPFQRWKLLLRTEIIEKALEVAAIRWKVLERLDSLRSLIAEPARSSIPTDAQVSQVSRLCSNLLQGFSASVSPSARTGHYQSFRWSGSGALLGYECRDPEAQAFGVAAFFASPTWANGYPPDHATRFVVGPATGRGVLPVYRIRDFKGLEADVVVLVWDSTLSPEALYVGASRAVYTLVLAGPSRRFDEVIYRGGGRRLEP